jgi:hypothetical protein
VQVTEKQYRDFLLQNEESLLANGYERITTEFGEEWVARTPEGSFYLPSGRFVPNDPNSQTITYKLFDPYLTEADIQTDQAAVPANRPWMPLADGETVVIESGQKCRLFVVECGELHVPSGRLAVGDIFEDLFTNPLSLSLPPGRYPVKVTLCDISDAQDGWNVVEAYASLILADGNEVAQFPLPLSHDGEAVRKPTPDELLEGLSGEGTLCLCDREAIDYGMPTDRETWHDEVFFGDSPNAWGPKLSNGGGVIVPFPLAANGANAFLMNTAGSEGTFWPIGGYDASGNLIRVHVECFWFFG